MSSDFESLCQLLAIDCTLPAHAAEIHGLGCGILAAGFRLNFNQLAEHIAQYTGEAPPGNPAVLEYFENSLSALKGDNFEFQLSLPNDDDYTLMERAESLSAWCMGFLHGFAAIQEPLTAETAALLRDLTEISQLDAAALDPAGLNSNEIEENEGYFIELSEFVRMAVIGLFMDYNHSIHKRLTTDTHVHH